MVEIFYSFVIDVPALALRLRHLGICESANMCPGHHPGANCILNFFFISHLPAPRFLDNLFPDAAITMGMVLLNEAATSKGDVGKRRSK